MTRSLRTMPVLRQGAPRPRACYLGRVRASGCRVCTWGHTGSPSAPRDALCCGREVKSYTGALPDPTLWPGATPGPWGSPQFCPYRPQRTFFAPFPLKGRAFNKKERGIGESGIRAEVGGRWRKQRREEAGRGVLRRGLGWPPKQVRSLRLAPHLAPAHGLCPCVVCSPALGPSRSSQTPRGAHLAGSPAARRGSTAPAGRAPPSQAQAQAAEGRRAAGTQPLRIRLYSRLGGAANGS